MSAKSDSAQTHVALHKRPWYVRMLKQWDLQLLVIPAIIYIFIFFYVPMYGIIIAFQEFRLGDTFGLSEWVGLEHFRVLFNDPFFPRIMRNNMVMGALRVFLYFPLPILFAVLLNELRSVKFKKFTQTVSYLPFFISWVVAATLLRDFLHVEHGAFNQLLMSMRIISEPMFIFGDGRYFWGLFFISHVWKEIGFGAIIYVAAITSIDQEQYEAASIDGASRIQKMWYITIAGIKPTIIILFILNVGSFMVTSFDQIMMLTDMMNNSFLRDRADILSTYAFRVGIANRRFSFASAVNLFATLINFAILLLANWIARRKSESSLF
ncbi:MAG: ABC transporter permease subunit [Firmicutes bacterium]|nr:ABC transporter permease subunit [Bacillota bacterium]